MRKLVQNLREKPEHVRKHILHITTFGLTCLVVLFWVYTLQARFSSPEVKEAFRNDLKPLTVLGDDIVNTYQNISANVSNIKK